jgi:hypothetical protein
MRALTLWQPWGWAIVAGHKLVENRPWAPPRNMIGVPFAIHAGKRWDEDGADGILDLLDADDFPADPLVRAAGAVIGVATIERVVHGTALRGLPEDADALAPEQRRWYFGPYGWVLRDVRRLDVAVPCRGFQMFWSLPPEVDAEVRRQLARQEASDGR